MDAKKSPEAIAILAKLKKPAGDDEMPAEDEGGGVDKEARLAAAEDILEAFRTKDAAALDEALEAHYAACGD